MSHCIIIGAGICGLIAAKELIKGGITVTIIEKSRGVGGRLATRRIDGGVLDHGAQYFTAKSEPFKTLVDHWHQQGWVKPWEGFCDLQPDETRWMATNGMAALAKELTKDLATELAQELNIHLNERVVHISHQEGLWRVTTDTDNHYNCDFLLNTAPAPQAAELITNSNLPVESNVMNSLKQITYAPSLALLITLNNPSKIPKPGGIKLENNDIGWIADNQQKGISPNQSALTIHATAKFSEQWFDKSDEEILDHLLNQASQWLKPEDINTRQVKRWRYALVTNPHSEDYLAFLDKPLGIIAGDGFGGPRVEGAVLSGLSASIEMLNRI